MPITFKHYQQERYVAGLRHCYRLPMNALICGQQHSMIGDNNLNPEHQNAYTRQRSGIEGRTE